MEVLLAATAAAVWGLGDFCGGRATRRQSPLAVMMSGQVLSLVPLGVLLLVLDDPVPGGADAAWGVGAGVSAFAGIVLLYHALANGSMTVVAPLTAVFAAIVPMAIGIGTGERPSATALAGVAVALVGIALVTGAVGTPHEPTAPRILMVAIASGVGIGCSLACLDRTSEASGMWPLLVLRIVSITLATTALGWRTPGALSVRRWSGWALLAGLSDIGATILFLIATRQGLLSLVAVIGALYPAGTILLAMRVDHERITPSQAVGMGCAGLALVLVTLGH